MVLKYIFLGYVQDNCNSHKAKLETEAPALQLIFFK